MKYSQNKLLILV